MYGYGLRQITAKKIFDVSKQYLIEKSIFGIDEWQINLLELILFLSQYFSVILNHSISGDYEKEQRRNEKNKIHYKLFSDFMMISCQSLVSKWDKQSNPFLNDLSETKNENEETIEQNTKKSK